MFENENLNSIETTMTGRPMTKVLFNREGDLLVTSGKLPVLGIYNVLNLGDEPKMVLLEKLTGRGPNSGVVNDFDIRNDSSHIVWVYGKYITIEPLLSPEKRKTSICFKINKGTFSSSRFLQREKPAVLVSMYIQSGSKTDSRLFIVDQDELLSSTGIELEEANNNMVCKQGCKIPFFDELKETKSITLENFMVKEAIQINPTTIMASDKYGYVCFIEIDVDNNLSILGRQRVSILEIKEISRVTDNVVLICLKTKKVKLAEYKNGRLENVNKYYADFPINSATVDLEKRLLFAGGGQDAADVAKKGGHRNFEILIYDLETTKCVLKFDVGFFSPINTVAISRINENCMADDSIGKENNIIISVGIEQGIVSLFMIKKEVFDKRKMLSNYYNDAIEEIKKSTVEIKENK